ncbi:MAG: hypothetical protein ACXW25_00350 [Rhodospirillales bacterium]
MDTRKIAWDCQGADIHGTFTFGVLNRILKAKENEENGVGDARSRRRFEIYGLSGTSAGALNAFIQLHKSQRITQRVPELRVSKARIA